MKKIVFILLSVLFVAACSKDSSNVSSGISANVDGKKVSIPNNKMGYAVSNGTSAQINGINSNDEGFMLFFAVGTEPGIYGMDTSSISVIYSPDRSSSQNYKLGNGILEITSISTTPTSVNSFVGTFSGWAFSNFNQSDSVEFTEGTVNFSF